jgi:Bacterial Ig-like domain (group 1)
MKSIKFLAGIAMVMALVACSGGGGSPGANGVTQPTTQSNQTTTSTISTITAQVSAVSINSSVPQVRSDGSTTATIIVNAIDGNNGLLVGADVVLSASTGVLSSSSAKTGANGQASFVFSSGTIDRSNRVATITVTSNGKSASTQVAIIGGSVSLDAGGATTLLVGGTPGLLTARVRDAAGNPVGAGVPVTFESSNSGVVTLSSVTVNTNASGFAIVNVGPVAAGNATVSASSSGVTAVQTYAVTSSGTGFYISSPSSGLVITTATPQVITVVAPGVSNVTFATPLGLFGNGQQVQTVAVVGGVASASFTSAAAGDATISVFDPTAPSVRVASVTIKVSPPVSAANKILLNSNKTNVAISTNGTLNTIQIKARAIFNSGGTDVGVFNVPILFSISGGPGAGESLSSSIGFTDASGNATTTFTAGSQASTQNGIIVHAQILGTAVGTGVAPSNNDLVITIGGQALSVVFSPGTTIVSSTDNTFYELPLSVQVSDANGGAVQNQLVSLNLQPFAFSTGFNACAGPITGTYCSEDANSNGSLDAGEDGVRRIFNSATSTCGATSIGTANGTLTPPNSAAGSVPSTVTTLSNGIAGFNLTYLKGSAVWTVVKLTATVASAGTESSFSSIFRLSPSASDGTASPCPLPASPYSF